MEESRPTRRELHQQAEQTTRKVRRVVKLLQRREHEVAVLQTQIQRLTAERDAHRERAEQLEMQLKVSKLATRLEQEPHNEELREWIDQLIEMIESRLAQLR